METVVRGSGLANMLKRTFNSTGGYYDTPLFKRFRTTSRGMLAGYRYPKKKYSLKSNKGKGSITPSQYVSLKVKDKRWVDVQTSNGVVSTTTVFYLLNAIKQGNAYNNRIGRLVRMNSVNVKLDFYNATNMAQVVALDESMVRVALVWSYMTLGTTPSYGEIFQDRDVSGGTGNLIIAGTNIDNKDKFKILWQEWVTLPAIGAGGVISAFQQTNTYNGREIQKYCKVGKNTAYFTSNAGTVADIEKGGIFLVIASDNGVQATPAYQFQLSARVSFSE